MSGMLIFALICAVLAIATAAIAAFGVVRNYRRVPQAREHWASNSLVALRRA